MKPLLALAAFSVVSVTLFRTNGHYDPSGVLCIVAALATLFVAAVPFPGRADRIARRILPWALLCVVEVQLFLLTTVLPGIYVTPGTDLTPFFVGVTVAGMVAVSYLEPSERWANVRLGALIVLFLGLAVWMVHASPRPFIDVWYYEQRAAQAVLDGNNPYSIEYPNIYGNTVFIDPSLLRNGRVQYHMYPPWSVLLTIPGYLLGDARYSLIAAIAGSAALLVGAMRRLGLRRGHPCELLAAALMFHARGFFLIEQAWTEPFPLLGACAVTYALARRTRPGWATAFFVSAKQYSVLWLPALIVNRRLAKRDLVVAGVLSAVVAAPFFLGSPEGLWHGVVAFQFQQPFRPDALSVLAGVLRVWGVQLPSAVGFAAASLSLIAGLIWIRRRNSRSLGDAALVGAAVYLSFFAFNKQAFFNYYWFSGAMILVSVGLTTAESSAQSRS